MTRTSAATITELGRVPWATVVEEVGDARCAWSDLNGFHGGEPIPAQAPIATHLWAWDGNRSWRFRIDQGVAYGARIDLGSGAVRVAISEVSGRDAQGQPSEAELAELAGALRLAVTVEPAPLTFLVEA